MYRTICCEFWTDPKVRALTPHQKLIFLYLITNPHSHLSGIYYMPRPFIEHEVGLNGGFAQEWAGLLASGLIEYDERLSQVWVVQMLPYQARGQNADKGVANHLGTLHNSPLVERFLLRYPHIAPFLPKRTVAIPLLTPLEPPSEGVGTFPSPVSVPDSDSDLNLKTKNKSENSAGQKGANHDFERFWSAYPRKVGKKDAQKAFQNAHNCPKIDDLLVALVRQGGTQQWIKEGGRFIPHPATWLRQGRWDDVPPQPVRNVFEEFLSRGDKEEDDERIHEPSRISAGLVVINEPAVGEDVS